MRTIAASISRRCRDGHEENRSRKEQGAQADARDETVELRAFRQGRRRSGQAGPPRAAQARPGTGPRAVRVQAQRRARRTAEGARGHAPGRDDGPAVRTPRERPRATRRVTATYLEISVDSTAPRRHTRSHAYVQARRHRDSLPGEHSKEWITGGACALAIEQYRMSHKASPETDEAFLFWCTSSVRLTEWSRRWTRQARCSNAAIGAPPARSHYRPS
ncbi:hypothetical protein BCEN4_1200020 [Burkholderia cenocepacia]|nr:hypothetical protein BCEN4_1200020 [Burkholderia cenocepacia]